jgi:hypothetical protein
MLPFQCRIAESKEKVHKTMLYALTFFSEYGKRNKYMVRKNFKMIGRKRSQL